MKNTLLFFIVSLFFFTSFAQSDSTNIPPYQRFPTLPPVQILLSDSATIYTKAQLPNGRPVLFMVFSPDCSHCQKETEEMIAHMDELKDVQIVMITFHPLWMMKDFITNYQLTKYPNIVVGKDIYYITPGFFNIHNIPYLAMYDKKGNLIERFEGSLPIPKVIDVLKEHN